MKLSVLRLEKEQSEAVELLTLKDSRVRPRSQFPDLTLKLKRKEERVWRKYPPAKNTSL